MFYEEKREGSLEVLQNIFLKQQLLNEGNPLHEQIRPGLLILSGMMRGVNGAGQVLALFKHSIRDVFDFVFGLSAGAPVGGGYVANQPQDLIGIFWDECASSEFLSLRRAVSGGHLMEIDFLVKVLRGQTKRGIALDHTALLKSRTAFYAGATCARTGRGVILDAKTTSPDAVEAIRASIAMPGVSHGNVEIDGNPLLDGAGAFPLPAQEVIRRFKPTDLLIFTNCPQKMNVNEIERLVSPMVLGALSPGAREAFATRSARFTEELSYLRQQTSCRYGVVWTGSEIGEFERNPKKLETAALRAEQHLSDLLSQAAEKQRALCAA